MAIHLIDSSVGWSRYISSQHAEDIVVLTQDCDDLMAAVAQQWRGASLYYLPSPEHNPSDLKKKAARPEQTVKPQALTDDEWLALIAVNTPVVNWC
jgi:hypothetical protein